jgi:hypothetical protein
MLNKIISDKVKDTIKKKVKREFPGCSSLQEIHFYRYIKELEQIGMSPEQRLKDDKERAKIAKKNLGL